MMVICGTHFILMFGILIHPKSDIRSAMKMSVIHPVFVLFLSLNLFGCFCCSMICLMNPGFLPQNEREGREIEMGGCGERYCSECKITQPKRTRHCKRCGRCVSRYDHHCYILGTCVGTKNKAVYWTFLLSEMILFGWMWMISIMMIETDTDHWIGDILIPMIFFLITGAMTVIIGILFSIQSFLAMTNQTQWEFSRKDKLDYLLGVPEHVLPFDDGILLNLWSFFMDDDVHKVWFVKSNPTLLSHFLWNDYYSCC